MKKRAIVGAAVVGLLFLGAAAWTQDPERGQSQRKVEALRAAWRQDPEPVVRQDTPTTFHDVLRGRVGQKVLYRDYRDSGARVLFFGLEGAKHTLGGVGEDFVQIREEDGTETYIPLSRVDVVVRPGK